MHHDGKVFIELFMKQLEGFALSKPRAKEVLSSPLFPWSFLMSFIFNRNFCHIY